MLVKTIVLTGQYFIPKPPQTEIICNIYKLVPLQSKKLFIASISYRYFIYHKHRELYVYIYIY